MAVMKEAMDESVVTKLMLDTFVWKGPKVNGIQEEIRLIDASYDQLKKFYNHCTQMLYNEDGKYPGRYTLQKIVTEQIQKCRAELLIRWLRSEKMYTATNCLEDLRTIIQNNRDTLTNETLKTYPIGDLMNGLPPEFERVPVNYVLSACLDSLGKIDLSHLTLSFITKLGLCFTQQEMQKDLYRKNPETGKAMDRLAIVKELMNLNPDLVLKINYNTGLTFAEFKAMYNLKTGKYTNDKYTKDKYSVLTSDLLRLLSNKVLYLFQNQCESQAKQWQDKQRELILIAESKGWDITRNIE